MPNFLLRRSICRSLVEVVLYLQMIQTILELISGSRIDWFWVLCRFVFVSEINFSSERIRALPAKQVGSSQLGFIHSFQNKLNSVPLVWKKNSGPFKSFLALLQGSLSLCTLGVLPLIALRIPFSPLFPNKASLALSTVFAEVSLCLRVCLRYWKREMVQGGQHLPSCS